ncbi:hypothetical protein AB0H43_14240 [Hamadaea sp. NPDC050747]|uniref:hypothetical protein n=1 Tax=Hamadaea sp. NPDC050747 TaxID=3155789 RepID=UPI0033EE99F2
MRSPTETFGGLLDRSIEEIAALTRDARSFDDARIGEIADIWDNNTYPLASAASAPWPLRQRWARAGLLWMADLGPARRRLLVDLDSSLDEWLPTPAPELFVFRDYLGRVVPLNIPLTADTIAGLDADYDLAGAAVRAFTVRPDGTELRAFVTVTATRRFTPSRGEVAPDGSLRPTSAARLRFTFTGVSEVRFDAEDRIGLAITPANPGLAVIVGRTGALRAGAASLWPDDPAWHESRAGRAADSGTLLGAPSGGPKRRKEPPQILKWRPEGAISALHRLMVRIRLVHYYPKLAATIPVHDLCRIAEGAGTAILAAGAKRGSAREKAIQELGRRWGQAPSDLVAPSIPSGPAMMRYAQYHEPHEEYFQDRPVASVLLLAVPDRDPAAPWRLVGGEFAEPERFRIDVTSFAGVLRLRRDSGALSLGEALTVSPVSD